MQEFIQYLLKGLSVVTKVFGSITFDIYSTTFTLTDLLIYSGIISFTLSIINKISSSGILSKKQVSRNPKMKGA